MLRQHYIAEMRNTLAPFFVLLLLDSKVIPPAAAAGTYQRPGCCVRGAFLIPSSARENACNAVFELDSINPIKIRQHAAVSIGGCGRVLIMMHGANMQ